MQLFDSELAVMDILWASGPSKASELAGKLRETTGWNRNTTYTIIRKLVDKGAIERSEPGYVCTPQITREQAQTYETDKLIRRMFDGSRTQFFASFLRDEKLSEKELRELRGMLEDAERE